MIAFPLIATCLLTTLHPVVVLAQTELFTAYSTQYLLSTIVDPISSTAVATTNSTIVSHAITETHVVPQLSSIVSIMTLTEELTATETLAATKTQIQTETKTETATSVMTSIATSVSTVTTTPNAVSLIIPLIPTGLMPSPLIPTGLIPSPLFPTIVFPTALVHTTLTQLQTVSETQTATETQIQSEIIPILPSSISIQLGLSETVTASATASVTASVTVAPVVTIISHTHHHPHCSMDDLMTTTTLSSTITELVTETSEILATTVTDVGQVVTLSTANPSTSATSTTQGQSWPTTVPIICAKHFTVPSTNKTYSVVTKPNRHCPLARIGSSQEAYEVSLQICEPCFVQSWETNNYNGTCLALQTGGSAAIVVPQDGCKAKLNSLCSSSSA